VKISKESIVRFISPWQQWWPLLFIFGGIVTVYVASAVGWQWVLVKTTHEIIAPPLLGIVLAVYLTRSIREKSPELVILAVLSFIFLIREIHFHHTTKPTYVALALWMFWVWSWRTRLLPALDKGRLKPWLFATGAAYVLSQVIAQRFFKYVPLLPHEHDLHVALEETSETFAHITFLVTAFADRFSRNKGASGLVPAGDQ